MAPHKIFERLFGPNSKVCIHCSFEAKGLIHLNLSQLVFRIVFFGPKNKEPFPSLQGHKTSKKRPLLDKYWQDF